MNHKSTLLATLTALLCGLGLLPLLPHTAASADDSAAAGRTPLRVQQTATPLPDPIPTLYPLPLNQYPHDPDSWTQGLLLYNGLFYESAGLYGSSDLREVDPATGEVLRSVPVADEYFAEGLALIPDAEGTGGRLIQLTWREGVAFVYDLASFEQTGTFTYDGEGWGLCYDGAVLWMSDGSASLFQRDPESFELLDETPVTLDGAPVDRLNELECVGDFVYANVWQTDAIVQIDKRSGQVVAVIDATRLFPFEERQQIGADVLNGIAYDAENEVFFITGKLWDRLFEVQFVEARG